MLFDRNLHMNDSLPNAKSSSSHNKSRERDSLRRLIAERSLCGLANDTKWNECHSFLKCGHVTDGNRDSGTSALMGIHRDGMANGVTICLFQ
jgi:hypothetical protein